MDMFFGLINPHSIPIFVDEIHMFVGLTWFNHVSLDRSRNARDRSLVMPDIARNIAACGL
jgi:hypothetical protein